MAIQVAPIVKAVAPILGGLFGRKSQPAFSYADKHRIQVLARDARRAGIHPLAALGSPVSSAFGTSANLVRPPSFLGDVAAAASNYFHDRDQQEANRLDNDLRRAQIDTERAKAAALVAEATSRTRASSARTGAPTKGGPIPLWVQYVDRDGNVHYGPNPDLPDLEQFPSPALIHGTDAAVGDAPKQTRRARPRRVSRPKAPSGRVSNPNPRRPGT